MPVFPRTFREKQALQQARTIAALCASSHPQGRRFPVHRQVSRLGFLRRNTFPAYFSPVAAPIFLGTRSLVCFTVAGTAPVLHRLPMFAEHARVRRRASLRTCVGCSFVTDIIHADGALVNLLRFLDTFPAICYNSDGRNRTCGFHPFSLHIISHTRCDFPCARGVSPCNKLRWGCEAVQRAIAKPSGRLRRGETPAIKKLTTEKAPFPQKKKAPLFGALCRTFPP